MRRVVLLLLSISATAAAGCLGGGGPSPAPDPDPPDPTVPALELGTGSWRFESIEDGQELALVRGAQGGWHVWLAFRVSGVEWERVMVTTETTPADGSREPHMTQAPVVLDPPDREGRRAMVAWTEILIEPSCLVGEMLHVRASLVDEAGTEGPLTAERYFIPTGGTYPPPACEPEAEPEAPPPVADADAS